MESQTLNVGTGPLLSFGLTQPRPHSVLVSSALQMDTFLQFCTLVNMSSQNTQLTHHPSHFRFGSNIEQKVIGCAISNSTNHQHGTTMMDPNCGGSLACLNTSFSSCVRHSIPNEEKNESFTDYLQDGRFAINSTSSLTSVSFTLCTFRDMTAGSGTSGAAISMVDSTSNLTVTQCFFHNCSAPSSTSSGGAIHVKYTSPSVHMVKISDSSFTECTAPASDGGYGGCVSISEPWGLTMSCNYFESCSSMVGSALYIYFTMAKITNSSFISCTSTSFGGALAVKTLVEMNFSFLQFRDCTCTDLPSSKDIHFGSASEKASPTTITFCDSTSGSPNVYLSHLSSGNSTLVPQLVAGKTAFISSMDMSMGENMASITIRTTAGLNGTMGVLLKGSNVPRLIHIEFGTPTSTSKTATAEVSIGTQAVLPLLPNGVSYTPQSVCIPGFSLVLDSATQVSGASLEFTDDTCSYLVLKVSGSLLPESSLSNFTVTIVNSSETFKVKFISSSEGQSEPISFTTSLDLEWEQDYAISSIEEDAPSNPQRIFCTNAIFTVPTPPHLTSARMECVAPLCTSVRLVFEGQNLSPNGTFVTSISNSVFSFTTTFNSSTSGRSEEIVVWPTNPLPLSGFTIVSMEEANANPPRWVLVDGIATIVPEAMITGVTCTLDHTATTYTIAFVGVFVTSSPLEVELKDELDNTVRVQTTLKDGLLTATEVISSVPPNNVLPGRTYTLVSANNTSIHIRPSLSFTTPVPPKVLSAETECANMNCSTINIVLRGQEFLSNRTFLLVLDGITEPIPFSCETPTLATIGPLQIGGGSDLTHSTTYTLISIIEDTVTDPRHILCDGVTFATPVPPKVLSAETECANMNCSTINIVLRGQEFLPDRTFLLVLDGITEPIPFSCETPTLATIGPFKIGTGFDFTHSTTYTLMSIVEDAVTDPHQILCDGVTFTTPSAPRLPTVYVSSWNGDDGWNCGDEPDPCQTMEHAFTRLGNGKSTLLLQGAFHHVSVWEISFSSLVISHNRVMNDVGSTLTHSTVRVGKEGGLVVDGATETRFESLSFVLHPLPAVEVCAEIKTGLLTIMNCMVTGDVSTSSSLSARHSSFVRTRNAMDLVRLTTAQLEHHSVTTLLAWLSVGLTEILKWEAESIHSQTTAGSAAFITLSNTSSLDLSSSSFASCSSSTRTFCSFVSCSVGDGGRGGGIGLTFSSDSSHNYLLDTLTFAHNTATFGRDLFLVAESLEKSVTVDHFLFNLHPPGFDRSNALFGSDRVAYVEETDLFPFLFPNNRFKNVFVDALDETGQASSGAECGRESHPCLSLHDAMDHLLNADNEEEVSQCVLERSLVLMGDLVFGGEGDVELCGYVTVGQQAGLVLSILPITTHKRTQTDPVEYGKVRFTQRGSIGCKLTFGLSEVVPPQTVLMKHLEFVLPLFSTHPQPIITVQSVRLSLIDCVVNSIDTAQPVSSLLSFSTSLTSMAESVRLSVSHLVAQNLILSRPLISIRSTADFPLLMDSLSTGHSTKLSQTLPFSLPPSLSIESSFFESVSLRIDATHDDPIETGSVLFADLSLPLSKLLIHDCSFSSCSTVIVSVPAESHLLSSFASGVCCFSLARSHVSLTDSSFVNCSLIIDPSCVVPSSPSFLSLTSHTLAVRFHPMQNISQLSSPLSAASVDSPLLAQIQSANLDNPSFLFDDTLRQSPLASGLELVGVEMEAGSSLDPFHPLPLALFVSDHTAPSLSTRSCVFRFGTADPLNVGLAVVRVSGGAWHAQRNLLFVNCTSSRREESRV
ncbi:hypothetical protein BLNAU_13262 [Blattamonas nauphoetae]|uniref:Uncharacterized protein n=1 Tax=Blattamonas nauphoetae TaxID=2049346 RepID=A0ABQ9XJ57_9EUKA|nr:hypothetical protein BLNAU_13262 [Blattamonas nauphoetae]